MFDLKALYKPAGDQPQAIEQILEKFKKGDNCVTLLGATGTGKTFTMANVIQTLQVPTIVISHNKTLAAQLATEFKHFFPNNAVHYFVSYFDYYQPESYLPERDMYIEKEATINKEIEMFRLGALASLLSRKDVIIVASVSALYGLGQKEFFEKYSMHLQVGQEYDHRELKKQLLAMQYKPVASKIEQGMFDFKGEILDVFSSTSNELFRIMFNEDLIEAIIVKDATSFKDIKNVDKIVIWPSSQYMQDLRDLGEILDAIEKEMKERVKEFEGANRHLEANRIKKRVLYDIRMIKETGFTNGIENYSYYFDRRMHGEPPNTIFDYFPDDVLVIIDESHMCIPQLKSMPQADKSRKTNLIEHGFRLASASDHRPLGFGELEQALQWDISLKSEENRQPIKKNAPEKRDFTPLIAKKPKIGAKTLFVSATPSAYELDHSHGVVQQIIRPTGLLDPFTYVYPKSGDYTMLMDSLKKLVAKKPHVIPYLEGYDVDLKKIFMGDDEEEIV